MRFLSVCPCVKRVDCGKTEEKSTIAALFIGRSDTHFIACWRIGSRIVTKRTLLMINVSEVSFVARLFRVRN